MQPKFKQYLILIVIGTTLGIWFWAEKQDYFQSEYKTLNPAQAKLFNWQNGDNDSSLKARFIRHFADTALAFPGKQVSKIRLFKNTPVLGSLTFKNLKQNKLAEFIQFCNNPDNYSWAETTWNSSESEWYIKCYNMQNRVVGKMYFCLKDCGMSKSIPFCPAMKFGGLSQNGQHWIENFIAQNNNWE